MEPVITQRSYDLVFIGDEPKLMDVTDLGPNNGYKSVKEMRAAVLAGGLHTSMGPVYALMKFNSLAKRLLTNTLEEGDILTLEDITP